MILDSSISMTKNAVRVTLNSPSTLCNALIQDLTIALNYAEDKAPKKLLEIEIRGSIDIVNSKFWPGETDVTTVNKWEQLLRRIERSQLILAVWILGNCTCEALELLLVADYRSVSSGATIHLSQKGQSVWPGMLLHRLSNQVGLARARRSILFGGKLTDEQMFRLGIIDGIISDELPFESLEWRLIVEQLDDDLPMRRRLLQDASESSFEKALGEHLAACDRCLRRQAINNHVAPNQLSDKTTTR